jgi:hypothetical protein
MWPWSFSLQKIIDSGEPRPRQSSNLLIASDYGGEHPRATHNVYSFLIVRGGTSGWLPAMQAIRQNLLPDNRKMSYKRLDDGRRQQALSGFLAAAADLDAHLVGIAVDKRKKWLSTAPLMADGIRTAFALRASWNARALEAMMRKVHFFAIIQSIWAQPFTNVTWITDRDEFVSNDARHDDALIAAARMTALYISHPMGVLRLNTTGQDLESTEFEDLCSIPDLAAGMLSEVSKCLKNSNWEDGAKARVE